LIGGACVAALAAMAGSRMLGPALPWGIASIGVVGLVGGVLGQLGDLVKSSFKRDAGVKDSGAAVPGLGGVIDIVDSPLFVAPFAYWLLILA
jgi:phosphatidate cytidylyltransferase